MRSSKGHFQNELHILSSKTLWCLFCPEINEKPNIRIKPCQYLNSIVHWSSCCVLVFRLQVSLLNSKGVELCGAVVLGRRSVLTSAHCLFLDSESGLRPSNFYIVAGAKPFLTKYYKLNVIITLYEQKYVEKYY